MTIGRFQVPVDSRPAGAMVVHEGKQVGVTPCVVMMTRASPLFELHLAGYHSEVVDVGTTRNWWVAGNFVTLGLGMVVDVIVGADRKPDTDQVVVNLLRNDGPRRGRWVRSRSTPEPQRWPEPSGLGYFVGSVLEELARKR